MSISKVNKIIDSFEINSNVEPVRDLVIFPTPNERVTLVEQIGRGSFATCWTATYNNSTTLVVVKAVKPSEAALKVWKREIEIHQPLIHPHIVQMYSSFVDSNTISGCILEWCQGGTLFRAARTKQLHSTEIQTLSTQLIDAVQFLHQQGIVHRDIKPNNILLTTGWTSIKLCDFGLATTWNYGDELLTSVTGTPNYVAPEVLRKKKNRGYTNLVDCWSTGCTIYFMFTGHSLYRVTHGDRKALFTAIRKQCLPTLPTNCVGVMRHVLEGLLQKDPIMRLSASQAHFLLGNSSSITL